jgi:hypothetical protein
VEIYLLVQAPPAVVVKDFQVHARTALQLF